MSHNLRLGLLLLSGLPWLAGCSGALDLAPGPRSLGALGDGEALAFSHAGLAGLPDLYLLNDQLGVRTLARGERYDVEPQWSPDGSRLLYQESYGWSTRLHVIGADGTDPVLLPTDDGYKFLARWAPDGNRIAFMGMERSGEPSSQAGFLYVLDLTSGELRQNPATDIVDYVWLPQGDALAAVVQTADAVTVEEFQADGDHVERIAETEIPPDAYALSLSPDGRQLAYVVPRTDSNSLTDPLYVTSVGGSVTNQVGEFAVDSALAWSPDGSRIALVTFGDGYRYALYTMTADGRERTHIMDLDTGDASGEILPGVPDWSPDGRQVAIGSFVSPGGSAIFVVDADGTHLRQVTAADGLTFGLDWRPR